MLKVLFLCTGNSCRSQMAEGWARYLRADAIEAYSAGTEVHGLNANAVIVMAQAGIDFSGRKSKTVTDLEVREFDYVITVCSDADQNCPRVPRKCHQDPSWLRRPSKTSQESKDSGRGAAALSQSPRRNQAVCTSTARGIDQSA